MGRDKAMLELEGRTLLARAVETLRGVSRLRSSAGEVVVTIAGERESLEGADRSIVDRYPGCGPLGGIEAALEDLDRGGDADWALFIPVDMPLLTSATIDALLVDWANAVDAGAEKGQVVRACLVEAEGRPQPLVSLVHREVHESALTALREGRYKVVPVLQSAGEYCSSLEQENGSEEGESTAGADGTACRAARFPSETSGKRFSFTGNAEGAVLGVDQPGESYEQFTNVNTEADLIRVATLLKQKGLRG
jgi:molybdopterin-guanine dinucleotide biosynthesis protein A